MLCILPCPRKGTSFYMKNTRLMRRGRLFAGMMGLLAAVAVAAPATASAEPSLASELRDGKSCAVVVSKTIPGVSESKVLHRACADTEAEAARKLPMSIQRMSIVTLWSNSFQTGTAIGVYADDDCDQWGYGISDLEDENDDIGISSYQTWGNCNGSSVYLGVNYDTYCGGFQTWKVNVPLRCNDHVLSMKVWKAF